MKTSTSEGSSQSFLRDEISIIMDEVGKNSAESRQESSEGSHESQFVERLQRPQRNSLSRVCAR